jgi:glyoxylase-like metal-dependent hydrolase (beta-lactamase superfamily II)
VGAVRLALLAPLLVACASSPPATPEDPGTPDLEVLQIGVTNLFLFGPPGDRVLVDTPVKGLEDDVESALADRGLSLADVGHALLTHGHHDHAGAAAALQARGLLVWAHEADRAMLRAGENEPEAIYGFEAALIDGVIDPTFPPVDPDVVLDDDDRLVGGGRGFVEHVGGHTRGSLTIVVDEKVALVGDLVRGGFLGGAVAPNAPQLHYFHADKFDAHRALRMLLARHPGVEIIWPSHGGPFTRAQLAAFVERMR